MENGLKTNYEFYSKILQLGILETKSDKDANDISKLLISLKKNPKEVLTGYPALKVKTNETMAVKKRVFYCYEPGKTY